MPADPKFRYPRPSKPELMVVADISGSVAAFDHYDIGVAVLDQRVDESHPECAGTDDEIIRLELRGACHAMEHTHGTRFAPPNEGR